MTDIRSFFDAKQCPLVQTTKTIIYNGVSMEVSTKLFSIIEKYGIDTIMSHYNNNQLHLLAGIGKIIEDKLIDLIEKNQLATNFASIYQEHFGKYYKFGNKEEVHYQENKKYIDDSKELYNGFLWLSSLEKMSLIQQYNILKHWIKSREISPNQQEIENNPMELNFISTRTFSFKKVDKIALHNNWWEETDYLRREYLLIDKMEEYAKNGHTYMLEDDIHYIINSNKLYDEELETKIIKKLIRNNVLICNQINNKRVYSISKYYYIEKKLSSIILDFQGEKKNDLASLNLDIMDMGSYSHLSKEQKNAIMGCLQNRISILNGGPGTGKTSSVIKTITDILLEDERSVWFTAPTHSAKNLGKKVLGGGIVFNTIQSVIFPYLNGKTGDYTSKLQQHIEEIDYIIIDEMSMVNIEDLEQLLAICDGYNVSILLVGDFDQLPPIGAGNPLKDIIESGCIPIYKLTQNFRSRSSDIPSFLHLMNQNYATFKNKTTSNYVFGKHHHNIHTLFSDNYIDILTDILLDLKKKGYRPFSNLDESNTFQIITPINSTINDGNIIELVRTIFYNNNETGFNNYVDNDIIILKKNTKLFKNGDYARLISLDKYRYTCRIKLLDDYLSKIDIHKLMKEVNKSNDDDNDHEIHLYENGEIEVPLDFIKPSYCVTIHSSQGLSFDKVITIYDKNNGSFINKNMNYTAISRAREDVYLLGIQNNYSNGPPEDRKTLLKHFLTNTIQPVKRINKMKHRIPDTDYIVKDFIKKRKSIPKKVKNDVWNKINGESYTGLCQVCNNKINILEYHTGHIISVTNGGSNEIDNLQPICSGCNQTIGSENLIHYQQLYYKKQTTKQLINFN